MATNPATTPPPASSVIVGRPEERPSGFATTMSHFVTVGKKPDKFDPEIVMANAGDKIRRNAVVHLDGPYFRAVVFILRGARLMQPSGNGSVAFEIYRQAALAAPYVLTPGQPFPNDEGHNSEGPDPATTTLTSAPPTASTISTITGPESRNWTAIAGVVVGGVSALALLSLFIYLFFRYRRRRNSLLPVDRHQQDFPHFSPMDSLNSPSSVGNPYFHGDRSVNLNRASELAPASPIIQPRGLSIHNPSIREPATRETVIISVTEEEKAMYLERLHALQTGMNGSGGVSPVSVTAGGHSPMRRLVSSQNAQGSPNLARTQSINRQTTHGVQSNPIQPDFEVTMAHEHGTHAHAQQPVEVHEMAASRFDEEKGSMDEEMTIVASSDGYAAERYGQVYPL
ncbi:hypothetical protein Dda_3698 [Drechslerella dactyloides]|uniref:Uncharacterized protein n=1 Tax=Drechslerella dactyloides TaxID=74499 RepID=A0AAD6IYF0_DREDA|nr:hypothetical protein Dda_3698 [Drechslerella dactyloides]